MHCCLTFIRILLIIYLTNKLIKEVLMIINKLLIEAVKFDPTKTVQQKFIFDMCKEIKDNKITLPIYQRDISWTLQKSVDLFNYQLFGKAPVSPISINNIDKNIVEQVSFIDRNKGIKVDNNHWSVVDGQQRLTTNFKAFINHDDFKNIVLDLGVAKFLVINKKLNNNQIPVGILLNENMEVLKDFIKKRKNMQDFDVQNLILGVRKKITGYNYTINIANDLTENEQIEWFEVLNNAGSRVSSIQLKFSKLKKLGIDIYKDYTSKFNEKICEIGYGNVFTPEKTTVSYPIAALNPALEKLLYNKHTNNHFAPIPSDVKHNQLCNLDIDKLKNCFSITLTALEKVLDFMNVNKLINVQSRIDYINYMIGYFIFKTNNYELNSEQEKYLINWFKNIDFNNLPNTQRRQLFSDLISENYQKPSVC